VLAVAAISTMKVDWLVANSATMGTKLSALVGLLDSAFPLHFSKTQPLVDRLPRLQISRWTIATIRQVSCTTWSTPGASITAIAPCAAIRNEKLRCYITAPETGKVAACMPSHLNLYSWSLIQHAWQGIGR
jgi:hypothetical protein